MPLYAEFERALLEAISAYKARRYAEAETLVDRLLERASGEPAALQLKALLAQLRGDLETAHGVAVASLAARPGHPPTQAIAGRIAASLKARADEARDGGRAAEAVRDFRRALELDTASAPAWFALGLALQDCGDYVQAAEAFARVIALTPHDAKAMVNHGVSLQQMGDLEGAWTAYRSAYQKDPSTFAAISQALPAASAGVLILDRQALRDRLSR
jgi:tetratricopeptide (TPR) repeat protein